MNSLIANLPRPPTKAEREAVLDGKSRNPIKLIGMLTPMQHAFFWAGWLAWTCDAYGEFFHFQCNSRKSPTNSLLSTTFFGHVTAANTHKITTSITLTLLFRSVGALTLGVLSDRFGRKWPLVINLVCIVALQIGTSFCTKFHAFLAVRSLFGIFMGGIWGVATASAMEAIPTEARGLFSGILQQGYAVGYLLAAVVNLYAVPEVNKWQVLFWIGAGITAFAAIVRLCLPESPVFLRAKAEKAESGDDGRNSNKLFFASVGAALKLHWARCVFAVVLMSFFNFFSHGSQDLYPTYMTNSKGFTSYQATVATIIANCGAIFGGTITGYISQYLGRRLTIIGCCLWTACFIPLCYFSSSYASLCAGAFFLQAGVQGAWGVVPIYLSEISPPAFRAVFSGLAYQLGNAASSSSAQIETTAGEHIAKYARGAQRPDYGTISGIIIGIVAFSLIVCCLIGKEYRGTHFEEAKTATQIGGGYDNPEDHLGAFKSEKQYSEDIGGKDPHDEYEENVRVPLKLIGMLTPMQHAFFWSGWLDWTADAYDFFCVSLAVNNLSTPFFGAVTASNTHKITTSMTLTLLFRSVGALALGVLSDRFGRKWPLVINLVCIVALQIGTGFCKTFHTFLAVRSLFGIFMGGIWGVATASSMEAVPMEARGLFSGILQQGYAVGYLVAAVVNLYAVPRSHKWEVLFWIGAGITAFAAIVRVCLPESPVLLRAKTERQRSGDGGRTSNKVFLASVGAALKQHWARCIFAVILMSFFSFYSHGSQDLYPTYMTNSKGLTSREATVATIISNCGAIFGGTIIGYFSQYLGDAAVQGAWGIVPIYLSEISPPAFRAVFSGLAYQLGNAASSSSAQIETTAGEHIAKYARGAQRPDYGTISGIIIGIVSFALIICSLIGKEYRGTHFEEAKIAAQEGGGKDNPEDYLGDFSEKERPYEESENAGGGGMHGAIGGERA
ncbi:MAG: hypothetical protein CYPHOPRED_005587 [Cyphobasidiales sp. Tagirdzhanova-0007]|nr:MAG: hypothetical protein CYPHOPRED_005587 [Cyphobasidiales sp. Tagirdzhanova-0007]